MKRTNAPGATVDNKFTDGNPATATPSTAVEMTWLNLVQEEICNVIEIGGEAVLNEADDEQLLDAIQHMIDAVDFTVPDASTTVKGIVELATNTEAATGTDTVRAVTPSGLKAHVDARTSSETVAGLVELATGAEVITGTDTARAVTPAGLAGLTSTTSRRGIVELATTGETTTGTDTDRAVTPAGLAALTSDATRRGLIELATNAEALGGTDAERALTSAALASGLSLNENGYVKLPGGLIIQWGKLGINGSSSAALTFPIAFPNACFSLVGQASSTPANAQVISYGSASVPTTGHTIINHHAASTQWRWIAIGW